MYFIAVFLRWAMSFMIFYNKVSCVVIKIAIVTAAVVVVAIIIMMIIMITTTTISGLVVCIG